ncbi:MAG: heparinase II/III family protein [Planctomycetota bacterium]
MDTWSIGKKQSQTNPNKANFKKAEMNVTSFLTKDYENKSHFWVPKKQTQISKLQKPMQALLPQRITKKTTFSDPGKTKPIKPKQTQFFRYLHCKNRRNFLWCSRQTNVLEGYEMSSGHLYKKLGFRSLLALAVLLCLYGRVCAKYPQNYLSKKLGAKVQTAAKLTGPFQPNALLSDGPVSKGQFAFGPVNLHAFTVDLGQTRTFDRIQLGTSGGPSSVIIEVSSKSLDGPFEKVFELHDPVFFQILRLPLTKARWIRFDFGRRSNRTGIHHVRIYKGYEHPNLAEVTRLLHELIKQDLPALKNFRSQVAAGNLPAACSELRTYFAQNHKPDAPPNPAYNLDRAKKFIAGDLNFALLSRTDPPPIDWSWMKTTDWYEHKNFLNRGSPLGVLADACYHTGSLSWAGQFRDMFYDWVNENPKPDIMSGADYPTWRTLDTAARLSWLTSRFAEVTAAKNVDDELWANYLYSIWEHTDYLKNDDFTGGNWLATVTSVVSYTARQFPAFRDREIWLDYGKTGFEKNVTRDIYPDGKEMEDAPGYICMAYNAMLATLESLEKEGVQIGPAVKLRLNKVQDFLAAVTQPNGIMPFIGDWGGCEPYALPTAMKHFDRDDIRYVLSKGKKGVPPSASSINFPHGRWSIMRSPYTERPYENARHLVFKSSSGAHGHLDVLSITAYAFGRELLIDPGIRSYERADIERYRQTSYHNTVCIDSLNQPRTPGKTDKWFSNSALDYVSGVFTGYQNVSHRRSILFIKPDYWFVRDHLTGSGTHTYDQNWHFAEDAKVSLDTRKKRIRTNYDVDGNILIAPLNPATVDCKPFDFFIATKRMTGEATNTPSKGFGYSIKGAPPAAFDTLLYPYQGSRPPSISTEFLTPDSQSPGMTAFKVTAGSKTDYFFIAQTIPTRAAFPDDNISIDAEILLIRTANGKPCSVAGKNIRKVIFRGETLFRQKEPAPDLHLDLK